jgi:hypothetical protein
VIGVGYRLPRSILAGLRAEHKNNGVRRVVLTSPEHSLITTGTWPFYL